VRSILIAFALLLGAGTVAATPAQAQNRFWLVNNSGLTIERAYVSPSRLSEWGSDILGRTTLPAGEQVRVSPAARDCELDIKVQYEGGQEEEKMKVNACNITRIVFTNPNGRAGNDAGGTIDTAGGGAGATIGGGDSGGRATARRPGRGGEPSFNFVNHTGETIQELYVSGSRDGNWGRDRLGSDTLSAGQTRWVDLPSSAGCNVDIRVVFGEGRAQERRDIASCNRTEITWP
jgi:hypothetical protein